VRDVLRWCVRQPRVWLAFAAFAGATLLAGRDGRAAWTFFVALTTFPLAAFSIRARYDADHPDRVERATARTAAKHQERVDASLWRYERQRAARERAEAARGSEDGA
jgi:hypothetical protein